MTQGRKRIMILFVILAALLAAVWGYLALTSRKSEDHLGYLVRGNGYGIENAAEYELEYQTGAGMRTEKKHGTEPGFHEVHEVEISEMKYVEEGKCCHG